MAVVKVLLSDHNYFKILNLPDCYDIDKKDLEKKYFEIYSKEAHNSIFGLDLINKSFNILSSEKTRAEHYLDIKFPDREKDPKMDINFLEEILNFDEKIDYIKDFIGLKDLRGIVITTLYELFKFINIQFKKNEFLLANLTLMKIKYFDRVLNKINNKLSNI